MIPDAEENRPDQPDPPPTLPHTDPTDALLEAPAALVAAAARGESAAWRELYARHAGRLLLWLRARPLGDAAIDADDVAHEAWLVAARRIAHFDGDDDEFGGWLFGVARKIALNTHRRSARRSTAPTDRPEADGVSPAAHVDTEQLDAALARLEGLPQRERDVLLVSEVLDLGIDGAASALGIRRGTARVARHRGLQRLRTQLEAG
ncbi:RNA polymerase sigma factor [Nocardioides acrostichi]|uniref:Sigma-70 family RNA polymerase sigma factor n=1 Tax=Nocardioides acrostichi TaxID=2784339 RepID=A0A930USQ2_9ACTN|nr:sigma-70 family RNA polymerase sigma factor [Nocardioides acrostichi]MBF4160138.1 sigma-70 family RNA polymerase sigma factor [Nocardioides acrostichi]